MTLPADYTARVYAGWLGKCIGVRFGAPLENWTYDEIRRHLGELTTYLRDDAGKIFKPDDDTAVPMILLRAVEDYGADLTAEDIGKTWLNYLGDQHGTLWWGGYGISTEHTAYLNMKAGIMPPRSGSIAQNGATMAEQIGGQIFSDIWGWLAPDNPQRAADYAEKASSISHDGEGIYGGRFIAALVSAAFTECDPRKLIEIGLQHIPSDSEYARVINAVLDYHQQNPDNWRDAYEFLNANFGYDRYSGVVHIIPNAGVVAIGLLYGAGDFSRSIQITNMAGWDTDCNVGNVGAIVGTAVGTDNIDESWRIPMNDLLIASSIIGTRNLLTIPQSTELTVNLGRAIHGESHQDYPRYHFQFSGSTNNFEARGDKGRPIHQSQTTVDDVPALCTSIRKLNKKGEISIFTRTSYRPSELSSNYYEACFTPLIYAGQTVTVRVYIPDDAPTDLYASLYVYDEHHKTTHQAEATHLTAGTWQTLTYSIPKLTDSLLSEVGLVLRNLGEVWTVGSFYLSELDWHGTPDYECTFRHERSETNGISQWTRLRGYWRLDDGAYHGSGLEENETYSGDIRWTDYRLTAEVVPLIGDHHYINSRVQGALRSYAFGLAPDQQLALYKKDGTYTRLTAIPFAWQHGEAYQLSLTVTGDTLHAQATNSAGTTAELTWHDSDAPYQYGQIGLSTWHGSHTRYQRLRIQGVT